MLSQRKLVCVCLGLLAALPLLAESPPQRDGGPFPEGAVSRLGQEKAFLCVAFAPDGNTLASGATDGTVRLWDRRTGQEVRRLEEKVRAVYAVAFSPDGKTLASALHDGRICLRDAETGELRGELRGHEGLVKALVFSPDGKRLASGGVDETVRFWDLESGKQVGRLDPRQSWIEALAFAPDGRTLACGTPYEGICLWDVESGRLVGKIGRRNDGTLCLAFSPDGRTLAVAGTFATIRLVELATGEVRGKLAGHYADVSSLGFAPDGRTLASGSADRSVRVWDLADGLKEVRRWQGHRDAVVSIAVSGDGTALASASRDTTALLWDLHRERPGGNQDLSPQRLGELWALLGDPDALAAYDAKWQLVAGREASVAFLRGRVRPLPPPDDKVARLIEGLANDDFEVRQAATAQLAKMTVVVEPALRQALARMLDPEARRRIEELLKKLDTPEAARARLHWNRALEVLEQVGGEEARAVVRAVAKGTADAPSIVVEAQATLRRMERRR